MASKLFMCGRPLWTADYTTTSIVIFLTMLFNVTIEAMKYHLLLEAADVQNDKGFYPQVDTVIH